MKSGSGGLPACFARRQTPTFPQFRKKDMSTISLGRLEKVDMREVWSGETNGFTPGLAQESILQMLG